LVAVITEFGGEDPADDKVKLALAGEILFLRGAMAQLREAIEMENSTRRALPNVIF
jgi:hypothetical protein